MRRTYLVIAILFTVMTLRAQLSVSSFTRMENDLTARIDAPMRDQNGDLCAIVKVVTNQTDFVWEPDALGIMSAVKKTGEYWLYVPHGAKRLTIKHPQLGILRNYQYPVPIEKATVYVMELLTAKVVTTVIQEATSTQWLIINSNPSGADVYINDQPVSKTPFQGEYPLGKYTWRLQMELYKNEAGVVDLTIQDKAIVQVNLKPNFGNLIVLTEPEFDASVSLDGYPQNKRTPALLEFIPVGDDEIRVTHPRYETTTKKVVVRPGVTDTVYIKMNAIYGTVNINTDPSADILINGQLKGHGKYTENLMPGFYTFEAKLDKHTSATERRTISSGQTIDLSLSPNPRLGGLKVVTTPPLAKLKINGEDKGTTPITLQNMLIGEYEVEMTVEGLGSLKKTVTISEGNITAIQEDIAAAGGAQKVNDAYTNFANQNFGGTVTDPNSGMSTVEVTTKPTADIFMNGQKLATGTWKGTLKPGIYDFEARADNFKPATDRRILVAGSTIKVDLVLAQAEGSLQVTTNPDKASVFVNGIVRGTSPALITGLPIGTHKLELVKDGYSTITRNVTITANQTVTINETMQSGIAFTINSTPSGAILSINDVEVGNTPYTGTMQPGKATITLKGGTGYIDLFQVIEVNRSSNNFNLTLLEKGKEIRITSVPLGAEVYINGKYAGSTPYTSTFDFGNYEIELRNSGYKSKKEQLKVQQNTSGVLSYTLESDKRKHSLKSTITAGYQMSNFLNDKFMNGISMGTIEPNFGANAGINMNAYPLRIDVTGFIEKYNAPQLTIQGQSDVAMVYHEGLEASMSFYFLSLGRFLYLYGGGGYQFSQLRMDFEDSVSSDITDNTYTLDTSGPVIKIGALMNLKFMTLFSEINWTPSTKEVGNQDINTSYTQFKVGIGF